VNIYEYFSFLISILHVNDLNFDRKTEQKANWIGVSWNRKAGKTIENELGGASLQNMDAERRAVKGSTTPKRSKRDTYFSNGVISLGFRVMGIKPN
jgi:hypothetical protein